MFGLTLLGEVSGILSVQNLCIPPSSQKWCHGHCWTINPSKVSQTFLWSRTTSSGAWTAPRSVLFLLRCVLRSRNDLHLVRTRVWPITQFHYVIILFGKITKPSSERILFCFVPYINSLILVSRVWWLFEMTWCPSRALNLALCNSSRTADKQGHRQVCSFMQEGPRTPHEQQTGTLIL